LVLFFFGFGFGERAASHEFQRRTKVRRETRFFFFSLHTSAPTHPKILQ
jgi:hypothetical protein